MINTKNKEDLRKKAQYMASILKIISNDNRLMTICFLLEGKKSVGEITDFLQISQPAVSQMLLKMKEEGILTSQNKAQKIFYEIKNQEIANLIAQLQVFCENTKLQ